MGRMQVPVSGGDWLRIGVPQLMQGPNAGEHATSHCITSAQPTWLLMLMSLLQWSTSSIA